MTPPPPQPARGRPRGITWLIQGDEAFGVRQAVLSLTQAVRGAGWDVEIAALSAGAFTDECRTMGFRVADLAVGLPPSLRGNPAIKAVRFGKLWAYRRRASGALARLLHAKARAGRPADAVHVLWPSLVGVAGAAARACGLPCFWEMPNALNERYPFGINRRFFQGQCDRYGVVPLSNSRYTAASLGDHPVRPRVMHLGVDPERFNPAGVAAASRGELCIPEHAVVVAVLGRIEPAKGQDCVLRAVLTVGSACAASAGSRPDAGETGPPLHLLLVGALGGPFEEGLRASAAAVGAEDRLHFVPMAADPERYYPVIDVPVNARVDAEPYGLSVVEAMMMAKPVLVHALGGPAETVIDGVTGWHVPDASVESLAAGLRRALGDRPRWPVMGQAARQHALANFTIRRQAGWYMDVVEEVLRSWRGGIPRQVAGG